jgi:hypothetical protein
MKPVRKVRTGGPTPVVICENFRGVSHCFKKIDGRWVCPGNPPASSRMQKNLDKFWEKGK